MSSSVGTYKKRGDILGSTARIPDFKELSINERNDAFAGSFHRHEWKS